MQQWSFFHRICQLRNGWLCQVSTSQFIVTFNLTVNANITTTIENNNNENNEEKIFTFFFIKLTSLLFKLLQECQFSLVKRNPFRLSATGQGWVRQLWTTLFYTNETISIKQHPSRATEINPHNYFLHIPCYLRAFRSSSQNQTKGTATRVCRLPLNLCSADNRLWQSMHASLVDYTPLWSERPRCSAGRVSNISLG